MDTIFINSENTQISDPYRLLLNLSDDTNSKGKGKCVALSEFSIYYAWINFKYQFQYETKSLNYMMDPILY